MNRPTHTAVCWWIDAWHEDTDEPHRKARPYPRVTCGFLVQDDDEGICLAKTWDGPDRSVEHVTMIPRGMIQRLNKTKIRWN
jgi:hypothetical protein